MLSWLEDKLRLLNPENTRDKDGGYTRLGFSKEEQMSISTFIGIANELELTISKDKIGNVMAILPGENPELPHIAFGSHLDTVKNGGEYDGVAGVLAGLGVIKHLKTLNYRPTHSIEVICFISEESSRFGVSTIGSKAMTGLLEINDIKDLTDKDNVTLKEALQTLDLSLTEINNMNWKKKKLHSFVELHIEQGPILRDSNCNIGVVTGIASPLRYKVNIQGNASHTGTTPMEKRKDALAIAARLITFIEDLGQHQAKKDHFVATVTTLDIAPNVMNVIPGSVQLGIDIRSTNDLLKKESGDMFKSFSSSLAETNDVEINLVELSNEKSVLMDEKIIRNLKDAAHSASRSHQEMISGAGHDAMNIAKRWPSGMIFIPCNGISHNPDEYTEITNIMSGVEVLFNYIKLADERTGVSNG